MLRVFVQLITLIVLLSGCSILSRGAVVQSIDPTEVSRAIIVYSEKMRYDKHLDLDDSIIIYDKHINRIRLQYSSMDSLNLREAREVLVDLTEGFLDLVNGNGQIYPQLASLPFTAANLEISIKYVSFYNTMNDPFRVALVSLKGGVVNYFAGTAIDCDTSCWHRRTEYYYQSRNVVNFMRQGEALYKPEPPKDKYFEGNREVYFTQ